MTLQEIHDIRATKKCIGNDVDKIQDIDTVPQERVVGDAGSELFILRGGREDIQIL